MVDVFWLFSRFPFRELPHSLVFTGRWIAHNITPLLCQQVLPVPAIKDSIVPFRTAKDADWAYKSASSRVQDASSWSPSSVACFP
jgi:hypothetical protein